MDEVVGDDHLYASFNDTYWICKTCDSALLRGQMPVQSVANNLELSPIRFVGFASSQQKLLQQFLEKRESVEVRNCQIKISNRDSDKLELLVKGATKIYPSSKKFDVSAVEFHSTEAIPMDPFPVGVKSEH